MRPRVYPSRAFTLNRLLYTLEAPARSFSSSTPLFDKSSTSPLLYPDPPTTQHSCISSFLAYATRSGLDTSSTVYVGTHYEYTVLASLSRYALSARRVGGASDYGIDLLGSWSLPSLPSPLSVIVQCKAGTQRIGPSLIRELEGSFAGAPPGWRDPHPVLALLVTEKPATKGVRDSLSRSSWPMGYISCTSQGLVRQMLWNRRAEEVGLEGVGVSIRYAGDATRESEIAMTWEGRLIPLIETPPS